MKAPSELHVAEAGDHSLTVTKTWLKERGESQADVDARAMKAIGAYLQGVQG